MVLPWQNRQDISAKLRISTSHDGRARSCYYFMCGFGFLFLHTSFYYFLWPLTVQCSLTVNTSMSRSSSEKDEMVNSNHLAETQSTYKKLQEICQIEFRTNSLLEWCQFRGLLVCDWVSVYLQWLEAVPLGQTYSYIWLNRSTDWMWDCIVLLYCKYIS